MIEKMLLFTLVNFSDMDYPAVLSLLNCILKQKFEGKFLNFCFDDRSRLEHVYIPGPPSRQLQETNLRFSKSFVVHNMLQTPLAEN